MSVGGKEDGTFRTLNLDFVAGNDNDYHSRLNIVGDATAIGTLSASLYGHISGYLETSGANPPQEEIYKWREFAKVNWSVGKLKLCCLR
jgi:hypothetical protein